MDAGMRSEARGARLDGKVAIITGGASGIGRASAELFAAEGASVLIVDREEAHAKTVATAIRKRGGRVEVLVADVAAPDAAEQIMQSAVRHFGPPTVLFNNAGVHGSGSTPEERWDDCVATNLTAIHRICLAVLPHMREAGGGSIVNNASVSGPVVGFASVHYDASKGGVVGLTRNLASQWGKHGIRVNALCPGFIMTPFIGEYWTQQRLKAMKRDIALGRLGTPEEMARVALFLASDESSYVTGATIVADGGWTVHYSKYEAE